MRTSHARYWITKRAEVRAARWGVLLSCLLAAAGAGARDPLRLLIDASHNEELERKVRAEASQLGLAVETLPAGTSGSDEELLASRDAVALVRLVAPDRAQVHVGRTGERGTYGAVLERGNNDSGVFAARILELVRGRLVELELLPAEGPPDQPAPAPAKRAVQPEASPLVRGPERPSSPGSGEKTARERGLLPMLWLGVGVGGSIADGGLGTAPVAAFSLRVEPAAHLTLAGRALLPVAENRVVEPEGQSSVRVYLFTAEIGYRSARGDAPFAWEAGPGAGFAVLPMQAEASAPRVGHEERLVGGAFFLHGAVTSSLAPWLRLRGSVAAGATAPRPVVRFDGRDVASWGRAFATATVDGEFGWAPSNGGGSP